MRVLICGGRDWKDGPTLYIELHRLHKEFRFTLVITGGARGVDEFAHYWAQRNKIETQLHVANWSEYGRKAGPIRNQTMIDYGKPDLVVAFPGSRGTADLCLRAAKAGIPIRRVCYEQTRAAEV